MPEVIKPFGIADFAVKPELKTRPVITDDIQQTLATIMGWDGTKRRLLTAALGGALHVVTPQLQAIISRTRPAGGEPITFADIPTTEVMIIGHPDNGGLIWVTTDPTPTTSNSWPLLTKEIVTFSIDNLQKLKIAVVEVGEKAIIAYTR